MNVTLTHQVIELLLKTSKSVTSERSTVRFNSEAIYVESFVPINNILKISISSQKGNEDAYEMDFTSFVSILKIIHSKESVDIKLSANKLLIEFRSKNKVIRTGDFKIVKSPYKKLVRKYNFLNITPEFLSQIGTHSRNVSTSNLLANINGIFIIDNNLYTANAYSVLKTSLSEVIYNNLFSTDENTKPFESGVFIPVQICSLINSLAKSGLTMSIDQDSNFVICSSNTFEMAIPIATFEMEDKIKLNITSIIDSMNLNPILNVNIPLLLLEIDPKLLNSMNPKDIKFIVKNNVMHISFKTNIGSASTDFSSNLIVENLSGTDNMLTLDTKDFVSCLNIASPYANMLIKIDEDRSKVCFIFGDENDVNGALFIMSLNNEE